MLESHTKRLRGLYGRHCLHDRYSVGSYLLLISYVYGQGRRPRVLRFGVAGLAGAVVILPLGAGPLCLLFVLWLCIM